MTEWDFVALMVEKFGLPGAVLLVLGWAIYRFGATPAGRTASGDTSTTAAIDNLRADLAAMSKEMTDRLARVETNIANLKEGRK